MRVFISLLFGTCACAWANPVPAILLPGDGQVFISSEHLVVTVSPTNATFSGTFTFAAANAFSKIRLYGGVLDLPIWLPAADLPKAISASLQKATRPGASRADASKLQRVLGLKFAVVGKREQAGAPRLDSSSFFTQASTKAGFQTLTMRFRFDPEILDRQTPVTISYCQPSLPSASGGQFIYVPVFNGFGSASTADTNRYSITLRAGETCNLTFTNGNQVARLHSGESVVCSPSNLQPIQGTALPEANQSVQRTGASRSGQEASRLSAAAGRPLTFALDPLTHARHSFPSKGERRKSSNENENASWS